jgi:hypothetical protein
MRLAEVRVGLRVRRIGGPSALVPDEPSRTGGKARRTGLIITEPLKRPHSTHRTVDVRWDGTDLVETIMIHRLEIAPDDRELGSTC